MHKEGFQPAMETCIETTSQKCKDTPIMAAKGVILK